MDDRASMLDEAYNRGLMPPDMKTAYEEARTRGIIGGVPTAASVPVGQDIVQSVAAAPRKVAEGLIGLPGTMRQGVGAAMDYLTGQHVDATPKYNLLPTSQDIQSKTSQYIGPSYQAQTQPGKYAGSAAEGAVGALAGPGSIISKLLMGVGSGLGAEAGKQYAPDHPIIGSLLGGVAGGLATGGAAKGIEAARDYAAAKSSGANIGDILGTGPVPAGAVRRVAQSAAEDKLTMPGVAETQKTLGPNDAMVMDLGRQLQGRAEQMAVHPGEAQNTVLNAVEGRTGPFGANAAARIADDLNKHLGPTQDVVHLIDRVDQWVQQRASPLYKQVMANNQAISLPAEITERPAVKSAMGQAEGIAANYGTKVSAEAPNLEYWDYVKKAMDHRINGMMRSGMDDLSSSQKADLGGLINAKQSLVSHLDSVTGGKYAEARAVASTKPELHDALDFGRSIFNSKLLPEEVTAHIADMSIPAREVAKIGARRELERTLSNVRNESAKARAFLDTNNNSAKIAALFGPDAAEGIANRVAAENTFQNATETIARNSRTAVRTELAKDTANPQTGDMRNTLFGTLEKPVMAGVGYLRNQGMANTRSGISDILTAKGDKMSPIIEQLLGYNAARQAHQTAPVGQQMQALVRALMAQQAGR